MKRIRMFIIFCVSMMSVFCVALTVNVAIDDETLSLSDIYPDREFRNVEQIILDETAHDPSESFDEKEKQIRDTLLRSTSDIRNRNKLSQVLPILRSMSREQRLAMAALIATQASARSGEELDLKQVETMFGERRNLILPVLFDIANIVHDKSHKNDHSYDKSTKYRRTKRSAAPANDDQKSFHENKLNMTNFRGTRETNDQQAIESQQHFQVTFPDKNDTSAATSMEQIEYLALKDLNGTSLSMEHRGNSSLNETNDELLPEPEQLIRLKGNRQRPLAEKFDNIYLYVSDYPLKSIMGSIRRHQYAMSALLSDNPDELKAKVEELEEQKRREDGIDDQKSGGMCPTLVRYARPQKARSASGEWKYIVNTGQHTQTLRLEKCTNPEQTCTYLTDNFSSRCAQVYNYHRLLSWDHQRGLHIDIFKVPTCCSCQIEGYREKFPPILDNNKNYRETDSDFQPSQPLYTVDTNDYPDNDDARSTFTPIVIAKKRPFEKRKKLKRPSTTSTYISPPSHNDYYGPDSFNRKQSSISTSLLNRGSNRDTVPDQIVVANDEFPEIIAPPPPLQDRPVKILKSSLSIRPPNNRNGQQKVLIKRVNYNYHPIIDFFFRDRALKVAKMRENRPSH